MNLRSAVALGAMLIAVPAASAGLTTVTLCADQWMPYNGDPSGEHPGYVVELARMIYPPRGVEVDYEVIPWDEALVAVREGRMMGVIGASRSEGEGMIIPEESIGAPPVCLITMADSTWKYESLVSFRDARLGVIKDYSYWPGLDAFIERKAGDGVVVAEGDEPLRDLMIQLREGKVDVVAESEPVLLWYLRAENFDRKDFRVVYKHPAEPVYVAFTLTDDGRRFAAMFSEGLRELRASGELDRLLRRYGLRDWQ